MATRCRRPTSLPMVMVLRMSQTTLLMESILSGNTPAPLVSACIGSVKSAYAGCMLEVDAVEEKLRKACVLD